MFRGISDVCFGARFGRCFPPMFQKKAGYARYFRTRGCVHPQGMPVGFASTHPYPSLVAHLCYRWSTPVN